MAIAQIADSKLGPQWESAINKILSETDVLGLDEEESTTESPSPRRNVREKKRRRGPDAYSRYGGRSGAMRHTMNELEKLRPLLAGGM